jgi:archaellum component FlaC
MLINDKYKSIQQTMPVITRSQTKKSQSTQLPEPVQKMNYKTFCANFKKMIAEANSPEYSKLENLSKKIKKVHSMYKYVNDHFIEIYPAFCATHDPLRYNVNAANRLMLTIYCKTIELEPSLENWKKIMSSVKDLQLELHKCRQILKPLVEKVYNEIATYKSMPDCSMIGVKKAIEYNRLVKRVKAYNESTNPHLQLMNRVLV